MARTSQRGGKNNNPEGRNQFSNGWRETARERPMAAAAAAAAAVGAGVFLWSRRNQISQQISSLSDQVGEWAGSMQSASPQGGSSGNFKYSGGSCDFSVTATTPGSEGSTGSSDTGGQSSQNFGGATGSAAPSAESGSGGTTARDRAF